MNTKARVLYLYHVEFKEEGRNNLLLIAESENVIIDNLNVDVNSVVISVVQEIQTEKITQVIKDNTYPYLLKNDKGVYVYINLSEKYKITDIIKEIDVSDECLRLRYFKEGRLCVKEINTINLNSTQVAKIIKYLEDEFNNLIINFELGFKPLTVKDELIILKN